MSESKICETWGGKLLCGQWKRGYNSIRDYQYQRLKLSVELRYLSTKSDDWQYVCPVLPTTLMITRESVVELYLKLEVEAAGFITIRVKF